MNSISGPCCVAEFRTQGGGALPLLTAPGAFGRRSKRSALPVMVADLESNPAAERIARENWASET